MIVDINTHRVKGQFEELNDFVEALKEKSTAMQTTCEGGCVAKIVDAIRHDIQKWIRNFEESLVTFDEAYEEIVALYIFSELYVKTPEGHAS